MAEIKNTFLKSKMNKDLDERLLPNGEYRDAQNIAISKSEDSNVGAAENIQGTELIFNGNIGKIVGVDVLGGNALVIIGQFADEVNSRIYLFLTDNTDPRLGYNNTSQNAIVRYDIENGDIYLYSAGPFLNFSTGYQIRSVNLIEDLLFWTDNRNQPRVININNPDAVLWNNFVSIAGLPYTSEDHLTVCKYNPYKAIEVWKDNAGVIETTMSDAVSPVTPMIGQMELDATLAPTTPQVITVVTPPTDATPGLTTAVAAANGMNVWTSDGQILPEDDVIVISAPAANQLEVQKRNGDNIVFRFNAINDGQIYFGYANPNFVNTGAPNYIPSYPGNQDFLTDKFVRFSYRFKFVDGEFSLMAPFTQSMFIPKQFGYFLENQEASDEERTYESTVVSFMENQVNRVLLQIPMPDEMGGTQINANELLDKLKVEEIEILYKESDGLAVSVVDRITTEDLNTAGAVSVYEYDYQATEPFKVLPEDQTTRVYDKVPVKALGQEIISNRVVYSNFQNKHTPPVALDYNVGVSAKIPYDEPNSNYSYSAYPNHNVKQNRYYQVGVVLSDRYGRTSTVLLSNNQGFVAAASPNPEFGADTIYVPYQDEYDTQNFNNIVDWPGNSLKVYFNTIINSAKDDATGTPGLYNGDPTDPRYNPLGWYTYKIVVKQKQQEYYNVYLPGILTGQPFSVGATDTEYYTSTITLFNDNINKVPRDLKEVGPDQTNFRSSVELYGKVSPELPIAPLTTAISAPQYNTQYLSNIVSDTVTQIAKQTDLYPEFYFNISTAWTPLTDVYDTKNNPYLARVATQKLIGSIGAAGAYPFFLSVYETKPVESRLEIFWETSTSGKIKELNDSIQTTLASIPDDLENFTVDFVENRNYTFPVQVYSNGQGPIITDDFYVEDALGGSIASSSITMAVVNDNGVDVSNLFTLVETAAGALTPNGNTHAYDSYTLQIGSYFVFLADSTIRNFTFDFLATNDTTGDTGPIIQKTIALGNTAPQFDPYTAYRQFAYNSFGLGNPVYFGVNGTADPGPNADLELRFSILSQTQYGQAVDIFEINQETGEITQLPQTIMSGPYNLQIAITDALGVVGSLTTIIDLQWDFGEQSVTCTFIDSGEAINLLKGSDLGMVIWSNKSTGLTVPGYNLNRPVAPQNFAVSKWSKIPDPQNPVNVNNVSVGYGPVGAGFNYNVKALDLSDGPSWCNLDAIKRGLYKGCMYITVTLTQTIQPNAASNNFIPPILDVLANVWIQRRDGSAIPGPWADAIDKDGYVVGPDTTIGGNWKVSYPTANQPIYALNLGSLRDISGGGGYPQPYVQHTMSNSLDKPQQPNSQQLTAVCTRTFAFDASNPAALGDYRVMVDQIRGDQTEAPNPNVTDSNNGIYNNDNISCSITYGDFYYPYGITNIGWQYAVMQTAEPSIIDAENYQGTGWTNVFAREPFFRYVTQFYTDSTLTTPWTPNQTGTNQWHAYKSRPTAGVAGGQGNPVGNDGAAVTLNNFNNSNSNPQNDRIWLAEFNNTGSRTGTTYPKSI
tara:strand:+ start:2802 stop:7367 length:4566 start_codon:yes stop_codon:yes gene_type:complete